MFSESLAMPTKCQCFISKKFFWNNVTTTDVLILLFNCCYIANGSWLNREDAVLNMSISCFLWIFQFFVSWQRMQQQTEIINIQSAACIITHMWRNVQYHMGRFQPITSKSRQPSAECLEVNMRNGTGPDSLTSRIKIVSTPGYFQEHTIKWSLGPEATEDTATLREDQEITIFCNCS